MSDRRRIGPPGRDSDGIEYAEFHDVDEGPPAPYAVPTKLLKKRSGCLKAVIIGGGMFVGSAIMMIVFLAIVGRPPSSETIDNNADTAANALDTAAAVAEGGTAASDANTFVALLTANDPRVCSDPEVTATVRSQVLPKEKPYGLSDDEFAQALELARVDLTETSASDIRPSIHEISCEANLRYGDGIRVFPIRYKIRPASDPDQPPVFYIQAPALAGTVIMIEPIAKVRSERPSPAEANRAAVTKDPTSEPQQGQGNAISDDALYAPHAQ